jgi:ParB family chromosome partitioning protein
MLQTAAIRGIFMYSCPMTAPSELSPGLQAFLGSPPRKLYRPGIGSIPLRAIRGGNLGTRSQTGPEGLEELAASIKSKGVIQPIIVRPVLGFPHQFEVVAGERRWQAAQLAGLTQIPAIIRELTDQDAIAVSLIENVQREELTSAEEARALRRLIEEFGLTHEQVAEAIGRSRVAVTNLLRLLDLPPQVTTLIETQAISMGHARALLGLEDDEERVRLAQMVAERHLSVRETESRVRKAQAGEGRALARAPDLSVISEVMRAPGLRVELQQRANGQGRITVEFDTPAIRDAALAALRNLEN